MNNYSDKEKDEINQRIDNNSSNLNIKNDVLSNLIRLPLFDKNSNFVRISYFELIVSSKGTSGLLGQRFPLNLIRKIKIMKILKRAI